MSTHKCGACTYEWGYSRNSQRNKKESELDEKRKKLDKKRNDLDKKKASDLDKSSLLITSDLSIENSLICNQSNTT